MKITVLGTNYTGAHFRMMVDPLDSRPVKLTLVSDDEFKLATCIMYNFSYGNSDRNAEDSIKTVAEMIEAYTKGEVPIYDGCGGVDKILDETGFVLLDMTKEFPPLDEDGNDVDPATIEYIDLGEHNLDQVKWEGIDFVNRLLDQLQDEGKLPVRKMDTPEGYDDALSNRVMNSFDQDPNMTPKQKEESKSKYMEVSKMVREGTQARMNEIEKRMLDLKDQTNK